MDATFANLFSPLTLRHKTLKNRIVFGAHTSNMSDNGLPGARHFGYYRERARGGAAMIVVEPVPVHRTGVLTRGNFRHQDDSIIPAFRRITDECHDHGDSDNSWQPYWSPSATPSFHDQLGSHAMTGAEIEEMIECFVQAARRAPPAWLFTKPAAWPWNCSRRPVLCYPPRLTGRKIDPRRERMAEPI